MSQLSDLQRAVRDAVVQDGPTLDRRLHERLVLPGRVAIHRHHYETSLVSALLTKFPGCVWLAGSPFLAEAARRFVRVHPPRRPCIAEYGEAFPAFMTLQGFPTSPPYLEAFGALEWCVGQVSIAVDEPSLDAEALRALGDGLAEARLRLQPGVRYLRVAWPVDELLRFYLADSAPERYVMAPADVGLEIRGARGAFRLRRLGVAAFAFRAALANGLSLEDAAERGSDVEERFDAGGALAALVAEGLVSAVRTAREERT